MSKTPMLERFAAQSLVEYQGELIFGKEKFAELIVRECADKCLEMAYVNPQPHHYASMIKEHFGVEE